MIIRQTADKDLAAIRAVQESAFGEKDEADLTANLLADPSATPRLILLAIEGGKPVGHILFTRVTITGAKKPVRASIL
jgi:putative acetyltransferase